VTSKVTGSAATQRHCRRFRRKEEGDHQPRRAAVWGEKGGRRVGDLARAICRPRREVQPPGVRGQRTRKKKKESSRGTTPTPPAQGGKEKKKGGCPPPHSRLPRILLPLILLGQWGEKKKKRGKLSVASRKIVAAEKQTSTADQGAAALTGKGKGGGRAPFFL